MSSNSDLIFEEWKASLKDRNRSKDSVQGNFEALFEELKKANIDFNEAHALLSKAVKAHLPSIGLARNFYKTTKNSPKGTVYSEKEFIEEWNKDIEAKGTNAFFEVYPRPKVKDADDDGEPKVFGNMSAKEYRAQRKYADQFPVLNTEELERKMLSGTYNPLEDISKILSNKDTNGNSN